MAMENSKKMRRFSVATLGCKVNQYESAAIINALQKAGLSYVPFNAKADCYIINTCTVTAKTDYQSRQLIRRAIRQNPEAKVVVTGCYAELQAAAIAKIPGVTQIVGNKEKQSLVERVMGSKMCDQGKEETWTNNFPPPAVLPGRTRASLKIEDGCDAFCSYCIVPLARGPVLSLPPTEVIKRLSLLIQTGSREVTLTGIHLGAYGRDLNPPFSLDELLVQVARLPGEARIRLSSIEPLEISERLISLLAAGDKICPHLHIPLQSGDDEVLARMNRNYSAKFIRRLINEITTLCPDVAIGMDVMVGFPGESEASFAKTYALLEELPIAYLHVFPYSQRPGTPASLLPDQVPEEEKRKRVMALRLLDQKKRRAFMARFFQRPIEIVVEQRRDKKTGLIKGISRHYLPVVVKNLTENDANTIQTVRPIRIEEGMILAEASR